MSNKKTTILVAEDDHFLRKVYMTKLTQEGFNVIVAIDGQEALDKLAENVPDLLLLDLVMPKINGFDVLEKIKKDDKYKDLPVIVLSNLGQPEDIQRCRELGAKDYLVKANFSINDVVSKIRMYVDSSKLPTAEDKSEPSEKSVSQEDKKKRKCPHCGKGVPKGAKFCPFCGETLSKKIPVKKVADVVSKKTK